MREASSGAIPDAQAAVLRLLTQKRVWIPIVLLLIVGGILGARAVKRNADVRWATDVALPEIRPSRRARGVRYGIRACAPDRTLHSEPSHAREVMGDRFPACLH